MVAAAAPNASTALVSTTRREMHWRSLRPSFMIGPVKMFPVAIRRPQIFIRSRLAHFIPELNLTAHETSVPAIGVDLAI